MPARMAAPLRMERKQAHEMKDASARASLEPTVSAAHLAAAITTAASMGIREKERVCDRIYAAQPNLPGSVLAQRSLGVSMPTIDILLCEELADLDCAAFARKKFAPFVRRLFPVPLARLPQPKHDRDRVKQGGSSDGLGSTERAPAQRWRKTFGGRCAARV